MLLNDAKLVDSDGFEIPLQFVSDGETAQYVVEFAIPDDFDLPDHPGTVDITVEVGNSSPTSFTKPAALPIEWPDSASASAGSAQQ
ncbi:hypothetical protein AQJ46_43740 [Streptomyces canus]|uniref:Uncharacterized protein n=1 Tax=Streptomyces canus TaxID=58343 RepID=A0A117QWS0_9ACTN|nr:MULTISPECIES: hypothetical protein [Streptomyces]KUN58306.1 hypothetical protein AQJ46_43740 [Streptomyces canus]MDI5904333.1 hypothetical protein [Streptomyces sp. 12257]